MELCPPPISLKLAPQKQADFFLSFYFFFLNPALKNISVSVADKKQAVCADCELSSLDSEHRDLPLLFWECVDCMTHALMYLSVSVPAGRPAEPASLLQVAEENGREARTRPLAPRQDAKRGRGVWGAGGGGRHTTPTCFLLICHGRLKFPLFSNSSLCFFFPPCFHLSVTCFCSNPNTGPRHGRAPRAPRTVH